MGNRNDYVDTLIAYVNSRLDFFNLWKRRVLGTLPDLAIMPTLNSEDDMSPEQIRTKTLVQRFLQQRDECYNDIPEVDYDSSDESVNSDNECAVDERNVQSLPSTSGHDWRKFILIRGKPGTGKHVLYYIAFVKL